MNENNKWRNSLSRVSSNLGLKARLILFWIPDLLCIPQRSPKYKQSFTRDSLRMKIIVDANC